MSTTSPTDNFWQRPEGTTGKVLVAMLSGIGLFALYKVLPFLITLAENMLYLGVLGVGLALFYMVVTSERVRTLVFYAFAMISRAITSNFVDIDPVAILNSFTEQMKKRREQVVESLNSILGVMRTLSGEIERAQKELDQALKVADAASNRNDEDAMNAQTEIAGRRAEMIERYKRALADVTEVRDALQKVKRRADYHITTSEDEVRELTRQNEIAKETRKATKAASAIFGDTDLFTVRNMAADRIRERYSSALGELDGYIESAKGIDAEIDLNQAVFQSEGKKRLAELRAKLSGAEPVQQLTSGAAPALIPLSTSAPESVVLRKLNKKN
jgi:phage shock protein A